MLGPSSGMVSGNGVSGRIMFPTKILIGQGCVVGVIAGGLWASTQWAALMLGNQPRLGAPLATVFGHPIYHPWRLFEWWHAYEAYAPQVFRKAGMLAAGSGVAGTMVAILGSLWRARQTKLITTYGLARWATVDDLISAKLFAGRGVFLGKLGQAYLRHAGPEHVLAFAPTRSGRPVCMKLELPVGLRSLRELKQIVSSLKLSQISARSF